MTVFEKGKVKRRVFFFKTEGIMMCAFRNYLVEREKLMMQEREQTAGETFLKR